jgi:hypothetical protein
VVKVVMVVAVVEAQPKRVTAEKVRVTWHGTG